MPAAESISGDAQKVRRVQDQCPALPEWGGKRQGCKAEGGPRVMKEITDKNQQVFLYPHLTAAEGYPVLPQTFWGHHSTLTAPLSDFGFFPSKAQTPNFLFKWKI